MFSKDGDKKKSFLGTQADLQGTLKIRGVLRLDGAASGRIEADQVILSETATMRGEILARRIIVSGYVEGILRATELLEITYPTAELRDQILATGMTAGMESGYARLEREILGVGGAVHQ